MKLFLVMLVAFSMMVPMVAQEPEIPVEEVDEIEFVEDFAEEELEEADQAIEELAEEEAEEEVEEEVEEVEEEAEEDDDIEDIVIDADEKVETDAEFLGKAVDRIIACASNLEAEKDDAILDIEEKQEHLKELEAELETLGWIKKQAHKVKISNAARNVKKAEEKLDDINVRLSIVYCVLASLSKRVISDEEVATAKANLSKMYDLQKQAVQFLYKKKTPNPVPAEYKAIQKQLQDKEAKRAELEKVASWKNKHTRLLADRKIKSLKKRLEVLEGKILVDTAIAFILQ
ncbi:MAG TPA: hypothetical protein PLB63_05885 [Planctomycetota bacterium]|jgi:DNA repair exonuclease SbcCD ATPase subunit|nr:hypothetical protein [Planctomycetota bacterium]HQB00619.1 hypothetical protein [Planctomycetota bacterium]